MACALGLLAGRAAGRWGAACLLCHCAARRGTTRTSVHATSSMIRPATPTPRPIFFYLFTVSSELCVCCCSAHREHSQPGEKESQRPCHAHAWYIFYFSWWKRALALPVPPSLSATILSAPTQPNVLCVPACLPSLSSSSSLSPLRSLSHVLVKKRQFDCTASPPLISSASPPRPRTAQPNKPDRIERIHSRERLLPLRARSYLSLSRLELLSNNPRSVGLFQLFQIAKQPRAYLTLL
jgi:hypothetical protein